MLLIAHDQNPFHVATTLEATGEFDVLEFDAYGKRAATPNDPSYSLQWNLPKIKMALKLTDKGFMNAWGDSTIYLEFRQYFFLGGISWL